MKRLLFLAIVATTCIYCNKNSSTDFDTDNTTFPDTLFVAYSVGAFKYDRLEVLYPTDAYVVFDRSSSDKVSISIFYSWGSLGRAGFKTVIPEVDITGMHDDFRISAAGVAAETRTWNFTWEKESSVLVDVQCSFREVLGEEALSLVVTPKDNDYSPVIKIARVSDKKVEYHGGDQVDPFFERAVFNNELDVPVSVLWGFLPNGQLKLDAHSSSTVHEDFSFSHHSLAYLEIDETKTEIDFWADGRYSSNSVIECSLAGGELSSYDVTEYVFNITPELYASLKKK